MGEGKMTKRQRRMLVKSDLLDRLASDVFSFDCPESHGLTEEEVAAVHDELGRQLYAWAVRITPKR